MRRMFFENAEGKAQRLNGKVFPQPPLVWRVAHGELKIRALCENKRPNGKDHACRGSLLESLGRRPCVPGIDAQSGQCFCGIDRSLGAGILRERVYARQCWQTHAARRRPRCSVEQNSKAGGGRFRPTR